MKFNDNYNCEEGITLIKTIGNTSFYIKDNSIKYTETLIK